LSPFSSLSQGHLADPVVLQGLWTPCGERNFGSNERERVMLVVPLGVV
jgi:hypothetical protein